MLNAQIQFTTPLGASVLVSVSGPTARDLHQNTLQTQRDLGRQQWSATPLPYGGFRFPLANHDDFDWSLIGASEVTKRNKTNDKGENEEQEGVWWRGEFYVQRILEANTKKKMDHAIKYSRGARPTEDPSLYVEGDEGSNFRYVTLASFRGNGKKRNELARPSRNGQNSAGPPPPQAAGTPNPPQKEQTSDRKTGTPAEAHTEPGSNPEAPKNGTRTRAASASQTTPPAKDPPPTTGGPGPAEETTSELDGLTSSQANLDALRHYIKRAGSTLSEHSDAKVTVDGKEESLVNYTRMAWKTRLASDFAVALLVALALESETGIAFEAPK